MAVGRSISIVADDFEVCVKTSSLEVEVVEY